MSPALQLDYAIVSGIPLVGTWNNIDRSTRDLARLVITANGGVISVNPFGAGSPALCNWGVEPAIVYVSGAEAGLAVAFTAQFKLAFADVVITGNLRQNELLVKTFTRFTDGSGRFDYYTAAGMTR
jgi:hypothetical protein